MKTYAVKLRDCLLEICCKWYKPFLKQFTSILNALMSKHILHSIVVVITAGQKPGLPSIYCVKDHWKHLDCFFCWVSPDYHDVRLWEDIIQIQTQQTELGPMCQGVSHSITCSILYIDFLLATQMVKTNWKMHILTISDKTNNNFSSRYKCVTSQRSATCEMRKCTFSTLYKHSSESHCPAPFSPPV